MTLREKYSNIYNLYEMPIEGVLVYGSIQKL